MAPVQPILHRVSCSYKTIPNAPKHYATHQNMSLGSNGVDWVGSLWKILTQLGGTNFCTSSARFAPSLVRQPTVPNAPKWYETQWNMSLGSNGVDRVLSLRNISMRLRRTKFCTSSARFATSFVRQQNDPKCTQMVRNSPKHEFKVQWGGSSAFVAKNSNATSWHKLLHLFGPFCIEFRKATKWSQMHQNCTERTKTWV